MVCLCVWIFNKQAADEEPILYNQFFVCCCSILPLVVFILDDCSVSDLMQLLNKETIRFRKFQNNVISWLFPGPLFWVVSFPRLSIGISSLYEVRLMNSYELILFNESLKDNCYCFVSLLTCLKVQVIICIMSDPKLCKNYYIMWHLNQFSYWLVHLSVPENSIV